MAEFLEESSGLESTTIGIYRTAATVKGGRRFSFGALVVVGDRTGNVGLGYGKAPGVPAAIEKAQKNAKKQIHKITLASGTIPHQVTARFLASKVQLIPASPGTGVIAGGTVRAVLELAGVRDCLTKSLGSNNQKNLAKATMAGLRNLFTKDSVEELRGVTLGKTVVDGKLEIGESYTPFVAKPEPPSQKNDKGKGKGGRKPQRGKGKGRSPKPAPAKAADAAADAPAAAQAPAETPPAAPADQPPAQNDGDTNKATE